MKTVLSESLTNRCAAKCSEKDAELATLRASLAAAREEVERVKMDAARGAARYGCDHRPTYPVCVPSMAELSAAHTEVAGWKRRFEQQGTRLMRERDEARDRCDGSCDIALARRQVGPDAIVPGNARECAELWEAEAARLKRDLLAAEAALADSREEWRGLREALERFQAHIDEEIPYGAVLCAAELDDGDQEFVITIKPSVVAAIRAALASKETK